MRDLVLKVMTTLAQLPACAAPHSKDADAFASEVLCPLLTCESRDNCEEAQCKDHTAATENLTGAHENGNRPRPTIITQECQVYRLRPTLRSSLGWLTLYYFPAARHSEGLRRVGNHEAPERA